MLTRPFAVLACSACLAGALGASGCGEEADVFREGLAEPLGGLTYNVYITRQLNLRDPEDRGYFQGPDPGRQFGYYGVFIEVCNESETEAHAAASDFKIVDTQGNEYLPVKLPQENLFAYRPRSVPPNQCIPQTGSTADTAPTGGALLLFKLSTQTVENRPLELEIRRPPELGAPTELVGAQPVESQQVDADQSEAQPAGQGTGGAGTAGPAGGEQQPAEPEVAPAGESHEELLRIELDI
jgi:hypothetical protein